MKRYSVCFTGKMSQPRGYLAARAYERGQLPVPSVTKSTDLLVLADFSSVSAKARKARRYGTRLLTEAAWRAMPVDATPEELEDYINMHMFAELLGDT